MALLIVAKYYGQLGTQAKVPVGEISELKLKSLFGQFGTQAKIPSGVTKDPHRTLIYGNTL